MKKNFISVVLIASILTLSCSKKSDDTVTDGDEASSNISESAMAEAGQQTTASEGSTAFNLNEVNDMATDFQSMDFVDPQDDVRPFAACSFSSARTTCTNNVSTLNWNGCNVGLATLSGGWSESWSSGFCANGASPGILINGASVTRASSGQTLTFASAANLVTNTTAHTAYDGTSIGSGVTTSMAAGTRTVVINGIRKILTGPRGRTLFDHSITSTGLSVAGTRAAGTRMITGNSTLFHNIAQYKAVHTFNSVAWGSSSCCYPTSGSISSTLTGSRTGSVTLAFTASCGQANFTDTTATITPITLTQCN